MKKIARNKFFTMRFVYYLASVLAIFILIWFNYDIETALLSTLSLASIFLTLLNAFYLYHSLTNKTFGVKQILYFLGFLFFATIIYFLPDRLSTFSSVFCIILISIYVLYDLLLRRTFNKYF